MGSRCVRGVWNVLQGEVNERFGQSVMIQRRGAAAGVRCLITPTNSNHLPMVDPQLPGILAHCGLRCFSNSADLVLLQLFLHLLAEHVLSLPHCLSKLHWSRSSSSSFPDFFSLGKTCMSGLIQGLLMAKHRIFLEGVLHTEVYVP